jgi:hypothetical protein
MSNSSARSSALIQDEYTRVCNKAGHIQYQISALSKDLELINQTLRDLNQEHYKVRELEKAEQAAVGTQKEENQS